MAKDFPGSGKVYQIVEPTIGYQLGVESSDSYWPLDPIPGVHCLACRSVLDYRATSSSAVFSRRDVTEADRRIFVSDRFRQLLTGNEYEDVEFIPIKSKRPMYEIRPNRIVQVDWVATKPRFSRLCPRCGQFECMLLGNGLFLKESRTPLQEGIYRTDLIWGCISAKAPDIIVAKETMEKIRRARLPNVYFWPVPYVILLKPSTPQGEAGLPTEE